MSTAAWSRRWSTARRPSRRASSRGAKAEQRTAKTVNRRRYGLLRELDLDIRLVVRVEPRGRGARVYSDAIYVATKTVQRLRKGGVADELVDREVISFRSDTIGRFAKGTVCVGTGKIEAVPLEPFQPVVLAAAQAASAATGRSGCTVEAGAGAGAVGAGQGRRRPARAGAARSASRRA